MPIYQLLMLKYSSSGKPVHIYSLAEYTGFSLLQKNTLPSTVKEAAVNFVATGRPGTARTEQMKINDSVFTCHYMILESGLSPCAITDTEYPTNTAREFLSRAQGIFKKTVNESQWKKDGVDTVVGMKELFEEFQSPEKVNKVYAIQKDVDDTKEIMQKNIQSMMERGEKIDQLDQTTQDIEFEAKKFHDTAVQLNTCCCCKCAFCANKCASCSRCVIF